MNTVGYSLSAADIFVSTCPEPAIRITFNKLSGIQFGIGAKTQFIPFTVPEVRCVPKAEVANNSLSGSTGSRSK
ncbi:hypothetical protein [Klebsiella oxytoca]|uniref:hypothetical protein n=1 Tax=Klebsiella oxytoca TaxID=571 RepID=UPI001CCDEF6D|nr:hypothetical protein [Klebsiella oxytoca]